MKDDKDNKSYFSVDRRKRKKNLFFIVPIIAAVIIIGISIGLVSGGPSLHEKMLMHEHIYLSVNDKGQMVPVPENIGIGRVGSFDQSLYGDHTLDKYGMSGMSPLHTHDKSGTVHIESNTVRNYTLGNLLDIWKGLDESKIVGVTVAGKGVSDFRNTLLNDKDQIVINISS